MAIKANIVKNQTIGVKLNQGTGGFNAPVQSVNDKTGHVVLNANDVGALPKSTVIPTKVSQLENDEEYLKSYTETDPTVSAWAKAPTKPTYTAAEVGARPNTWTPSADDVGADSEGTAETKVSEHNTNTEAHNDIRLLIQGLTSRLNALADSDDVTLDQMSELVAYIKDNRELIEGVTTNKVNVSDIINNLTTNVADKPLAAAMGVELVKMIEDVETPANLSELKEDSKHRVVSDAEKARWNSKSEFSGSYKDLFDQPFGETWLSKGSDTLASDNIIYGGYHKASNTVPSMEDIEKGYAIKYHRVSNGVITGDPIALTNSNADMSVHSGENGILISYDGLPFVIVSFTGIGTWSALKFSEITSPGVYFLQDAHICVESIKLTGYDGFPLKVLQGGVVKTVNHVVPDKDGNVNVESGSGGSNDAFDMIASNTLTWNGDASGKVLVNNLIDSSFYYVKVSSIIPTLEDFQKGGIWASVDPDGVEYDELFADGENITENDTLIDFLGGYILIVKENNAHYVTNIADCTFPETGVYFAGFTEGGYISKLTITDFKQFTRPILKKESLPAQHKDWYGVVVSKGNTVVGDGIVHNGFVKVSDSVPTEAELQAGGKIRYYNVEDGEITGDLITANYPESPYSILARAEGILIAYDGLPIVVISINGSPNIGPFVYDVITGPGVYFNQGSHICMHSLTIDGYTEFDVNYSKIPMEFIPDGIGGGADWNAQEGEDGYIANKPFGETTVMGDTVTFNGDLTGKTYVSVDVDGGTMHYVKVSDAVPTIEDLQNGGSGVVAEVGEQAFDSSLCQDVGQAIIVADGAGIIVKEDNADLTEIVGAVFPKKGFYVTHAPDLGVSISSITINGYTGFEMEIPKRLPAKYAPAPEIIITGEGLNYQNAEYHSATCNKSVSELLRMEMYDLLGTVVECPYEDSNGVQHQIVAKVYGVNKSFGDGVNSITFYAQYGIVFSSNIIGIMFVLNTETFEETCRVVNVASLA